MIDFDALLARLQAPTGQFRLVALDRWQPPGEADTDMGVFSSVAAAQQRIKRLNDPTLEYLVYDDKGNMVFDQAVRENGTRQDTTQTSGSGS